MKEFFTPEELRDFSPGRSARKYYGIAIHLKKYIRALLASILILQACSSPMRYCSIHAAPDTKQLIAKVRLLLESKNIKIGPPRKTVIKIDVKYFIRFYFDKSDSHAEEIYLNLNCNGRLVSFEYRKFNDADLHHAQIN